MEKIVRNGEFSDVEEKVLYWFFSFPTAEMGLSDLASVLKISKLTASIVVRRLVKEEFLRLKVYGKAWSITSNVNHPAYALRKIPYTLNAVNEIYYRVLRKEILNKVGYAKSIILFGSYRKGDDTEKSDLDIAVEVSEDKQMRIVHLGNINIGYRKNVPVNLYIFNRNKIDLNLFANIANGIVLEGFLEVRP